MKDVVGFRGESRKVREEEEEKKKKKNWGGVSRESSWGNEGSPMIARGRK